MNAVLDIPRAEAAADDGPSPSAAAFTRTASPSRGGVFELALPAGPLRLRIDTPALRHALDAAIALQRCEPLLLALEAWLRQPLDWSWTEIPRAPAPRGSQVRVPWRLDAGPDGNAPQGSIELPWALLRALPAPDAALATLLQPPLVPAQLVLSRPRLQAEELRQIEPGGALLLPESFQPSWQGLLRAAGEDGDGAPGVPVRLESPLAPRLGARDAPSTAAAGALAGPTCEVRLDLPHGLSLASLAGWQAGAVLEDTGPGASLWLRAHERAPALCLARGRLLPWGCGWALFIETLEEADDATLPVA